MAFSGAFVKPFRPAFDAGLAAAAVPWYLAGGAPTPIVVYQPKGAVSLAASYVNLVTPGTYNAAPGTAPTLDASGWVFNGSSQYLATGVVPSSNDWSMAVRFSGATVFGSHALCGIYTGGAQDFSLWQVTGGSKAMYINRVTLNSAYATTAGILAMAGKSAYYNGAPDGTIGAGTVSGSLTIAIGAVRQGVSSVAYYFLGSIQAVAIWDTSTGHATWMPAVNAAVALI